MHILALEVSRNYLLLCALGAVAAVVLVAVGRKRAEHHKAAQAAAAVLREWGLAPLADVLDAYAVDDFRGIITAAKVVIDTLKDPGKRDLAFSTFASMLLQAKFSNPATRDAAIKFVDDLKATTAPGGLTASNLQQDVKDLVTLIKTKPQLALQAPSPAPAPAAQPSDGSMSVPANPQAVQLVLPPGHSATATNNATPGGS